MRYSFAIMCLLLCCYSKLAAQNQCTQSLDRAKALFADGHLYEVPGALEECLNRGFSRDQKIEAYHLLTMTYLYMDNHAKADEMYMELLKLEPEFDVQNDNDNIEIVYLNNKFKTTPIFTLTARAGINSAYPVIINDYDINQNDPESYNSRLGYWFGPGIDLNIEQEWKIGAELIFRRTSFYYKNFRFNEDHLEVTQVQNTISLPVLVKYIRRIGSFDPYIYGGVAYDFLIASSGNFIYENRADGQPIFFGEAQNEDLTDLRNRFGMNLLGGIGIKKRIGYHYFFLEFRFMSGLKNIVKESNRYPLKNNYLYDFDALYKYTYIDDDMRMNSFGVSIGYEKPFYKPRHITNKRGFFYRIFN